MVEKDRYLVVVSVLEGRKFPKRAKHKLLVEARFDGELLASDAVDHTENPDFTQELAWELDKKGLHQHRLQRTSIKVQVYAIESASTVKEPVGYVVLDLRSAQQQQTSKWYPLLHGKYSKSKPEVRLGLYLDEDKGPAGTTSPIRPASATALVSNSSSDSSFDPKTLRAVLNDTEGYYQIGPLAQCKDSFVLSVTIAFASNLPQLIPTNIPLPSTGFFFYYSLLGNDVTNELFHDLINPSFPAERASVRLRSSAEAIRAFFARQPGLQVHLCCGDQSLGQCDVPLQGLLKKGSTEIYMKPVTMEGAYQLFPPSHLKTTAPPLAEDMRPLVGVAITLRKEDVPAQGATPVKETLPKSPTPAQKRSPSPERAKDEKKKDSTKGKKKDTKKASPPERPVRSPSPTGPATHDGSYTDTFDSLSKTEDQVSSLGEKVQKEARKQDEKQRQLEFTPPPKQPSSSPVTRTSPVLAPSPDSPGRKGNLPRPKLSPPVPVMVRDPGAGAALLAHAASQPYMKLPVEAHHFCCSIDLRSFKALDITLANVFVRYTYPFFGSAAPILTSPSVEVRKGMEVLLPQAFCAFDFATTAQQLQDTFNRVPVLLEFWDRDKTKSQNVLLGAAQLHLDDTLAMEQTRAVHSSGVSGWRQTWSSLLPVVPAEGAQRHLGEVQVVVTLEDWGPISHAPQPGPGQELPSKQSSSTSHPSIPPRARSPPAPAPAPTDPRETQEYQAALELEVWKDQQEQTYKKEMAQKERQYMTALADEWKRRDKEREILLQKKMSEYHQLEDKLRKTINDLDKRDKQLAANEQEVMRLSADLQREHERKMTELREASRRLKEDCDHKIELERNKVKEQEEYVFRLKQQLQEAEVKHGNVQKEFDQYKEQQACKPEVRLQSEINLLTLEKVELERKLDAVTKSKVHYKQQWGRALKELARLKQKEQAVAKQQLRRQQQELEHMRLRYLAAEEKEVVKNERKELEDIRQELQTLKDHETLKTTPRTDTDGLHTYGTDADDQDDDHISRLIEERDTLLRTGVYSGDDRIITELDRQIRDAIAKKGR